MADEKKDDRLDLVKLRQRIRTALDTHVPTKEDDLLRLYQQAKEDTHNSLIVILGSQWTEKTELALSLKEKIDYEERGYFLRGGFTHLHLVKPHIAIFQAVQSFARQVLQRGEQEVDWVRKQTREVLGDDAGLLASLMPALEQLLGGEFKKKNKRKVAREGKRFLSVLGDFLAAMASKERPMVVFMENLDLADQPSLEALKKLLDHRVTGLVFLATCDTNVSPSSTLAAQLREMEERDGISICDITLKHMTEAQVKLVTSQVLECDVPECESLCQFLCKETKFTPKSLSLFLEWGLSSNSIYGTAMFGFSWDERAVQKVLTKDLVKAEIQSQAAKMGDDIFVVLKKASCLGETIDLSLLDVVTERDTQAAMSEAAAKTFFVQYERDEPECGFCCEEARQSVYESIPEDERSSMHLSLGKKIWKRAVEDDTVEMNVFSILSQLCKGAEVIIKDKEKTAIATLCLFGGQRAAKLSAFQTASHFLQVGISLLPESSWTENYDLMHSLHTSAAELAVYEVSYDKAEVYIDAVLRHGRCVDDMVPAYCSRMMVLSATDRVGTAVDTGLQVLEKIGVELPSKPGRWTMARASWRVRRLLRGKSNEQLLRLPMMTNLEKINAMRVLILLQSYTHLSRMETHALTCLKMVELTLEYGHSTMSPMAFAWYGVYRVTTGSVRDGCCFAELALATQKEHGSIEYLPRLLLACYGFVFSWNKPYAHCLEPLQKSRKLGYQTGDTESVGWASNLHNYVAFENGTNLNVILDDWTAAHKEMTKNGQINAIQMSIATVQVIRHLIGLTEDPLSSKGDLVDFEEAATAAQKSGNIRALVRLRMWQMRLAFIFNDYQLASRCALIKELRSMPTSLGLHGNVFFGALVYVQAFREGRASRRELKLVKEILASFREWSLLAPENFSRRKTLIEAELAAVEGRVDQAYEKYVCAIALSHNTPCDHALANERTARHLMALNEAERALPFFQASIDSYAVWGAKRKSERLVEEVNELFHLTGSEERP